MTTKLLGRVIVPAVLLIVVGLVWVSRRGSDPTAGTQPPTVARVRGPEPQSKDTPVADLKLELLSRAPDTVSSSQRNPFRFAERAASAQAVRRAAPPTNVPAVFQGPPPPPPIPLRFIGILEAAPRTSARVGIFSDGRGAVLHGREGEIIEGRYRVLRMGPDTVELAYADGRGRQTIRLSGQ